MVEIITKPENFTPIREGVVFVVNSDEEVDFDIGIVESQSGVVVGRKVVYGSTEAVVDIAPYVANMSKRILPERGKCALKNAPVAEYHITVDTAYDSIVSEKVVVSNNLEVPKRGINSLLPQQREIGYGEEDDLRIYVPAESNVMVQIISDRGEYLRYDMYSESGAIEVHLATKEFQSITKQIVVDIFYNNMPAYSALYTVVPRYNGAVRLMWLSPAGNIEHYTFPIKRSQSTVVEKRRVSSSLNGEVVSTISAKRLSICSNNEKAVVREALTTVVTATKVWIEEANRSVEATVIESEMVTSQFGKTGHIAITLEYDGKEVVV